MKFIVKFSREPAEDIEVVKASKTRGQTMLQKLTKQFRKELDQCKEIRGTYKIASRQNDGGLFVVEMDFDSETGDTKGLLVRLLQYGYERYGWAGTFEVL